MRKIITQIIPDQKTFEPKVVIRQKMDDGTIKTLFEETPVLQESKYTKEQQQKIDSVNAVLSDRGEEPLTEEECDYMLDPDGMQARLDKLDAALDDAETLQRMAGFKVEKKIIPLD